jgi:hypothetical protein
MSAFFFDISKQGTREELRLGLVSLNVVDAVWCDVERFWSSGDEGLADRECIWFAPSGLSAYRNLIRRHGLRHRFLACQSCLDVRDDATLGGIEACTTAYDIKEGLWYGFRNNRSASGRLIPDERALRQRFKERHAQ